jgi:periplasmic protein CpxP/Spy
MARSLTLNRSTATRAVIFAGGLVCGVGLAALIVIGVGFGRSPTTTTVSASSHATAPQTPSPPVPPTLSSEARAAVDDRINELQSRLAITPAQMAPWSAFGAAMRDNAAATDAVFAQRAAAVSAMSAVENMRSYAQIARAYADNTERLANAFDSLYESLSETQKQAADTLFREQAVAAAKPQ